MSNESMTGTARVQVEAHVIDLSVGGALLRLAAPLEVGVITDFCVPLDTGAVWVQGEVKRCTPTAGGYEVGLQFVGVHPQDERRLRECLARPR